MNERGPRRVRSALQIAMYWYQQESAAPFALSLYDPRCFRCGYQAEGWTTVAQGWSMLERAHLVDRALGGLDGEQNLAMLCAGCHRIMPSFDAGQGDKAIAWVRANYPVTATTGEVLC